MTCKKIINGGIASLAFLSFFVACMSVQTLSTSPESQGEGNIELSFSTSALISNPESYLTEAVFYLFDASTDAFLKRLYMTQTGTTGTTVTYSSPSIEYGTYDLVIVNPADELPTTYPTYSTDVMYTMSDNATSCPDIFYVSKEVTLNSAQQSVDAVMNRNLSKLSFRLVDSNNLLDHSSNVKLTLTNVPSTLDWNGDLVCSSGVPVSINSLPVQEATVWSLDESIYVTDTIHYVIPAHRGSIVPTYDMTLYVEGTDKYGQSYSRSLTLSTTNGEVPGVNERYLYNLTPGDVDLKLEIVSLDWDVVETQDEVIDEATSELECMVIATNGTGEAEIMPVYSEWNVAGGYFYSVGSPMEQTKTVYAYEINDSDNVIEKVYINNRTSSIPYSVLVVETTGNTGEAIVGIKLDGDNFSTPNDGYRWKWHVIVTDDVANTSCNTTGHPNSVNTTN